VICAEEKPMSTNVMQNSEILPLIRAEVRDRLIKNPRFAALPDDQRTTLAQNTVTALAYILGGPDGSSRPDAVALSDPPASHTPRDAHIKTDYENTTKPGQAGDTAGRRMKDGGGAVAADTGTDALGKIISKVDFPAFVGGLIKGVFDAINTSTMAQLKAYSELVKNVAKSVEEFMKDNVSEGHAKDYLLQKYPKQFEPDMSSGSPKLVPKSDADEDGVPAMFKDLGLPADSSVDEDTIEEKLVPAARRRMALDRQQMLATMVMMGVNRLVVTNGSIEASVLFELKTRDEVKGGYRNAGSMGGQQSSSDYDGSYSNSSSSTGSGFWGALFGGDESSHYDGWYKGHSDSDNAQFNVSTSRSEDSSSKVDLHTKLTGKVHVNFKSDYFPMERMTDVLQINAVKEKAMGEQAVQIAQINANKEAAKNAPVSLPPAAPIPVPAGARP